MKIAFIIGVNDIGGAEYVSYQHIIMAQKTGLDIIVISGTGGYFHDKIKEAGIRTEIIGMSVPSSAVLLPLLKDCDTVFNCNNFIATQSILQLKPIIGFKYLTIVHSNIDWVFDMITKYDKSTDGYYLIHQRIAEEWIKRGIDERKLTVIPNCVDTCAVNLKRDERNTIREQFNYSPSDIVIGMVTRINNDKNIKDAVRIISKLPENYKLLIIGGPSKSQSSEDYFNQLLTLIRDSKLMDRIKITGNQSQSEVYRFIHVFDIGLNCSPSEGLPIALLEMMAAGIPCVFPSFGEIPDILEGNGVVIPIRQRMSIKDILREPNYERYEILRFVTAIKSLSENNYLMNKFRQASEEFIIENRDMKIQEKQFINFLTVDSRIISCKKISIK